VRSHDDEAGVVLHGLETAFQVSHTVGQVIARRHPNSRETMTPAQLGDEFTAYAVSRLFRLRFSRDACSVAWTSS
jgi:hypothetical protein